MRVTERWKGNKKPSLSFEIFPARTLKGMENLVRVINELITLEPDFFSVTFGAGGSTKEGSLDLLKKLRQEKDLDVIAYFAGYGLGPEEIVDVLDKNQETGVENILVVRGDPPQEEGFLTPPGKFSPRLRPAGFHPAALQFLRGGGRLSRGTPGSTEP